jgi:hypothetical protein
MAVEYPSSTTGSLFFFVPPADGQRAYQNINVSAVTKARDSNVSLVPQNVEIENLRGKEDTVTLDTLGFQIFYSPAKHTTFKTDAEIESEYYPESIELIKRLTGATRVVPFEHSTSFATGIKPTTSGFHCVLL